MNIRRLTEKHLYLIAIASIAALTVCNQIVVQQMLSEIRADGRRINLAGRQRMLSQRIALLADRSTTENQLFTVLKEENELWNKVHLALQNGDPSLNLEPNDSPDAAQLFASLSEAQKMIYADVAHATSPAQLSTAAISREAEAFLPVMTSIVATYENESRLKVRKLETVEIVLALASLLFLVAEFFFIFRPIINELRRRQQTLEKLNESKDRVMAAVAHDIRNPLTTIQMATEILKMDIPNLSAEQLNLINTSHSACKKAEMLIQELLDISVLESAEYKIDVELTALEQYCAQILKPFKWRADEKHIDLKVTIQPQELTASIDPHRFSRVLENLVTNALKFTPESGRIEIRSYQTASDLILEIRDTGIGIPPELKEVIFDKFSKARRTGTRGEISTGLGMSIVKGIVEKHSGRIWLESKEGQGTSFYISLPQNRTASRLSVIS